MNITRKEFFRQALFSFGRTALAVTGTVRGNFPAATQAAQDATVVPATGPGMVAEACNGRCLAGNCGCFACVERCETQAIRMVPGEGIRVDKLLCNGCGSCEYLCPVTPKAVVLVPRS